MEDIIFISNAARGDHPGCRQGQSLDRQIEGSMKNRVVVHFMFSLAVIFLFSIFFRCAWGCKRRCCVHIEVMVESDYVNKSQQIWHSYTLKGIIVRYTFRLAACTVMVENMALLHLKVLLYSTLLVW